MNLIKSSKNLFNLVLVIFFLFTLLFSFIPTFYRGNNIYLFTFFIHILLLSSFLLSTLYGNKIVLSKENSFFYGFFLIWIIYNMMSFWWSKIPSVTAQYSFRYFCFFTDFFIASQLFKTKKLLTYFYYFLQGIVIVYIGIAIWELLTWNHLPTSRLFGSKIFTPTGTFYNENDFAEVLLFLSPFIIFSPKLFNKIKFWKLISFIEIIIINVLFLIQGARIAIIFSAFILGFSFFKFIKSQHKFILSMVIIGGIFLTLNSFKPLKIYANYQYETNVATLLTEQKSIYVGSIGIREQMIKNAIVMSAKSFFFGTGGGTYEENMRVYSKVKTAGIINCHNFIFEMLATNGVMIFMLFLYFLFRLFKINFLAIKKDKFDYMAWMNLFFILLFISASFLSSSSYKLFYFWPILGLTLFNKSNITD